MTETATDAASTDSSTVQSSVIWPTCGTSGGMRDDERGQRDARDGDAGDGAADREHGLLGDQLPDQTAARCAERGAQRHFADALDRSAEHQRAEVHGGEHQDQSDRAEQDQQSGTHIAGDRVLQRLHADRLAPRRSDAPRSLRIAGARSVSSRVAASGVTPGASRATLCENVALNCALPGVHGSGAHRSVPGPKTSKPAGITPTIVCGS